jgi:NTE family protein
VVLLTERGNRPLLPTSPPLRAQAVAFRAALLMMHQQIERDLLDVSRRVPTVVLPTGIAEWPAPWDFRHSRWMIDTASRTAGHFLDELRISGPGLYRSVGISEPPAAPRDAAEDAAETTPALEAGR